MLLGRHDSNFAWARSPPGQRTGAILRAWTGQVAWQSPRFWETDRQIYGGLSFIHRDVQLIWYPSGGYFEPQGVLIGCYNFDDVALRFMEQPLPARLRASRDAIDRKSTRLNSSHT